MSKIKNGGLNHYGAEPYEKLQFGTAGIDRVRKHAIILKCKKTENTDNIYSGLSGHNLPRLVRNLTAGAFPADLLVLLPRNRIFQATKRNIKKPKN